MKRIATCFAWHAECAELYEAHSDAEFASGRFCVFCEFCVRKTASGRFCEFCGFCVKQNVLLYPVTINTRASFHLE